MAQCKWCGRSGFFLAVTSAGVCTNCQPIIAMDIQRKEQIIFESLEIIKKTKNFGTAISRYDLILDLFKSLLPYEQKGLQFKNLPQPSVAIKRLTAERDDVIVQGLEEELQTAIAKSKLATTPAGKTSPLAKVSLEVRDYSTKTSTPEALRGLGLRVNMTLHQTQLQLHLDAAQKAEIKGQKKKALEAYYDALYFLTHDDIEDSLQKNLIDTIKKKITDLGGVATEMLSA